MASQWDLIKDQVLTAARSSNNRQEWIAAASKIKGGHVSWGSLERQWYRWRVELGLPKLDEYLASDHSRIANGEQSAGRFTNTTTGSTTGQNTFTSAKVKADRPAECPDSVDVDVSDLGAESILSNPGAEGKHTFRVPRELADKSDPPSHGQVTHAGPLPRRITSDGDNHYRWHDPYVETAKLKFIQDVRPDTHVSVGDQYDFWHFSRFDKPAAKSLAPDSLLQAEFDAAQTYWKTIDGVCSNVYYILGNHENRLQKLINANLGFFGLRVLDWPTLAGLPAQVKVIDYGKRLRIGGVTWEHGDRIGGRFGVMHPSHWLLTQKGDRNTIFGHTHRVECKYRKVWDEGINPHVYGAWNQGHGSDERAAWDWQPEAGWQHGFTYVEMETTAGKPSFTVHQIVIVDGKFHFNGRVYSGHTA